MVVSSPGSTRVESTQVPAQSLHNRAYTVTGKRKLGRDPVGANLGFSNWHFVGSIILPATLGKCVTHYDVT